MRMAYKFLRWFCFAGLAIVVGSSLYFALPEAYLYLTKSDVSAQAKAEKIFQKICADEGLDPHSFRGPDRPNVELDKMFGQYNFAWTRFSDQMIYIGVTYLPSDSTYTMSETLVEAIEGPRRIKRSNESKSEGAPSN